MKAKPVIFGVSGTVLTAEEIEFFKNHPVEGFILFRRNIQSAEQLKELVCSLKSLYDGQYTTLVLVDQEGGRVCRVKPPIASKTYPSAEALVTAGYTATADNYHELMTDLKRFGIDSPTCPVLDLRHVGAHDVIGDRSFGSDVAKVVALGAAAISAIMQWGGLPVIKHIPGHGRALTDSHNSLPTLDATLEELQQSDFLVFKEISELFAKEISEGKIWGMTAHIVVKDLDGAHPATLSKTVIDYIRSEIGFRGKIITDDIAMKALHQGVSDEKFTQSLAHVAHDAIDAGCDIVLHCTGVLSEMSAIYAAVQS